MEAWQLARRQRWVVTRAQLLGLGMSPKAIRVHRRIGLRDGERREVDGIPLTDPLSTLVDAACGLTTAELERAANETVQRDLVDPEAMRAELDQFPSRPGAGLMRRLLDRDSYVVTDTRLEQLFVPIARAAGLPSPQTQAWVNGHRVDFFWPKLGLGQIATRSRVGIETDQAWEPGSALP
jgi:hypothetical protein